MTTTLSNLFSLKDRIAVITGAGGDLCSVIAKALGTMGVKIAILDLKLAKAEAVAAEIRNQGGVSQAFACDVLNLAQLQQIAQDVDANWGTPDFLINGAGGNNPRGSTTVEFLEPEMLEQESTIHFLNIDPAGFRETFDLNFFGTVLPTQVFSRGMVAKRRGAIINFASMSAIVPLTKVAAYSAAKAAVANLTHWLAVHFSHVGVRVNALAPGFFMTEQLRFLHIDQQTGQLTPRAQRVMSQTPMGRYGDPTDLIGVVAWLLSDSAQFVTGTVIPIDGGFSSLSI